MNTEDLHYSIINPVRRTSRGCVKDIGRTLVEPLSQESLRNLGLGSSMGKPVEEYYTSHATYLKSVKMDGGKGQGREGSSAI